MHGRLSRVVVASLGAALLTSACGGSAEASPARLFVVTYQAEGSPGEPLAGVQVNVDGEPAGVTDEHGLLQSFLLGRAGQTRVIEHGCPEGWAAPEGGTARTVQLSRDRAIDPAEARLGIQVKLRCAPEAVRVAVVVDAAEPGLEASIDGTVVGTTDEDGLLFHVARAAPGSRLDLAFEAPGPARRRADRMCDVGRQDSICTVRVRLQAPTMEEPVRRRRRRRPRMTASMEPPVMRGVFIPEAF